MNLNEVIMRTFRTLLTLGLLSTAMLAQDLTKPSAALKDEVPATALPVATTTSTTSPSTSPTNAPSVKDTTDLLIDRIIGREHFMMESMSHLTPMLETYVQNMKPDNELGFVPASDEYFLGRLDFAKRETGEKLFVDEPAMWKKVLKALNPTMPITYVPRGFISTMLIDGEHFDRAHYDLTYVRREFLGDVRCLVFDVTPMKKGSAANAYTGRIWVEDQEYNIVRTKGSHDGSTFSHQFHSDVWRQNLRPGLWLPTYVYSEESDMKYGLVRKLRFKSQTRLWGYDVKFNMPQEELTRVLVDDPNAVRDHSEAAQDMGPVQSQRAWEIEAQENVLEKLEKAGLLAPKGEVDKVLETVVNNLMITNNLDIQPEVHCRVLLTAPLESFTVGHTIVLSRGLLDVLPDESSLAMALGHELAHIVLGHRLDTKFAFNDRTMFPDEKTFHRMGLGLNEHDETAADTRAIELLQKSPYKDKLSGAGLFLKALDLRAGEIPNLLTPRLGSPMFQGKQVRMSALMQNAPELQMTRTEQIAALPLGGRVKMDPWTNAIELSKTKPVPLLHAREKMPFEVTPLMPYIHRVSESPSTEPASQQGAAATTKLVPANLPKQ
jgi:peptidase M48-like protein